jgi:hypothetical protein
MSLLGSAGPPGLDDDDDDWEDSSLVRKHAEPSEPSLAWLSESNVLLTAKPKRELPSSSRDCCLIFCFGFGLVGAIFLIVVSQLILHRYPYLTLPGPVRRSPELVQRQGWSTLWAGSLWALVSVSCGSLYIASQRCAPARVKKAD